MGGEAECIVSEIRNRIYRNLDRALQNPDLILVADYVYIVDYHVKEYLKKYPQYSEEIKKFYF